MKILVLGSGGREHALVWKLAQSQNQIFSIPGNGGISEIADTEENIGLDDFAKLKDFVRNNRIDFTVVGPEAPLVAGIVDEFKKEKMPIFGPSKIAAQLEGSKAFSKNLMAKYNIPTANFEIFTDERKAKEYLESKDYPLVIKASGLAFGKGAIIVQSKKEGWETVEKMMTKREFGPAGETIVIEDFLCGEEASIISITDGSTIRHFLPAQDHKPLLDNDQGPNTGGMGAYAPAPLIDEKRLKEFDEKIGQPLLRALQNENIEYKGVIYFGLIITDKGPYVLEFNCRFGDPETQPLLPLLRNDLAEVLLAVYYGKLQTIELKWEKKHSLSVVAASKGYPASYEKGKLIKGNLKNEKDIIIFHSGTKREKHKFYTSGGRVLSVTGIGETLFEAKQKAYKRLKEIEFDGIFYRQDIGDKGIKYYENHQNS